MHDRLKPLAAIAEKGKIKWQTIPLRTRRKTITALAGLTILVLALLWLRGASSRWKRPSWTISTAATGRATARPTVSPPTPTDRFSEVYDADSGAFLILPSAFGAGERDLAGLNMTADDHEFRLGMVETLIAEKLSRERG
jgi:hypothetical protein